METTIRSLKRWEHVLNDWRGGQVITTSDPCTIRIQAEQGPCVKDKPVALSLVPAGARSIGAAVVCRVTGTNADNYVIVEVHESTFNPQDAPRNNALSVAQGRFSPGVVTPREGADWTPWWTA